jgi:hypothetical protein
MVQKISLSTYIHDPSSFVNQSFASLIPLTCYIYIFHGTNILQKNRKDYYDGDLFWHTLATICEFNYAKYGIQSEEPVCVQQEISSAIQVILTSSKNQQQRWLSACYHVSAILSKAVGEMLGNNYLKFNNCVEI